jgi:hypothetical protein
LQLLLDALVIEVVLAGSNKIQPFNQGACYGWLCSCCQRSLGMGGRCGEIGLATYLWQAERFKNNTKELCFQSLYREQWSIAVSTTHCKNNLMGSDQSEKFCFNPAYLET